MSDHPQPESTKIRMAFYGLGDGDNALRSLAGWLEREGFELLPDFVPTFSGDSSSLDDPLPPGFPALTSVWHAGSPLKRRTSARVETLLSEASQRSDSMPARLSVRFAEPGAVVMGWHIFARIGYAQTLPDRYGRVIEFIEADDPERRAPHSADAAPGGLIATPDEAARRRREYLLNRVFIPLCREKRPTYAAFDISCELLPPNEFCESTEPLTWDTFIAFDAQRPGRLPLCSLPEIDELAAEFDTSGADRTRELAEPSLQRGRGYRFERAETRSNPAAHTDYCTKVNALIRKWLAVRFP